MFEIELTVMPRMVKEHGEIIINIYLSEIIRDFLEILHSFGHMVAIIGNSTFRILSDSKFLDKQMRLPYSGTANIALSIIVDRVYFAVQVLYGGGCSNKPAISCTYL